MDTTSVLVNGEATDSVSVFDRALQFSDGLFETIAIVDGSACLWQRHVQRLAEGCLRLNISPPSAELLASELSQIVADNRQGVVKILISRGSSQRGYGYAEDLQCNRILYFSSFPGSRLPVQKPLNLITCSNRLATNPQLAGLKHTGKLEQVLAKAELSGMVDVEGLMQDIQGNVIEGISSNLFLEYDGILHTPHLRNAGVKGVVRSLLADMADDMGTPVIERQIIANELIQAQAIYVTNSLIGIVPIRSFEDKSWNAADWKNTIINSARKRVFQP